MSVLIVIPARMKATRLPNKPMASIGGVPMIVQVWKRAMESGVGEVIVACDGPEIADAITKAGGVAILTDPDHPSGSDRIWEAVTKHELATGAVVPLPLRARSENNQRIDADYSSPRLGEGASIENIHSHQPLTQPSPARGEGSLAAASSPKNSYDIILNLQGDVPTLEPRLLQELLAPLDNPEVDIATLAAEITRAEEHDNPSVVKAIIALKDNEKAGRALYFTRATAPTGEGPRYHHIGVYAYRRTALERFVSLPPSPLELREKLEQLRALEAGMRIDAVVVDTVPLGIDTPEDLARARKIMGE